MPLIRSLAILVIAFQYGSPQAAADEPLRSFLLRYASKSGLPADPTTRYVAAPVSLDGDGRQLLVYMIGQTWCGTGGCPLLVLSASGSSYKLITEISITRAPISVLSTSSHGWHDIAVLVAGGGIDPPYIAKLSYDGTTYPENPTVPPARPLRKQASRQVVISETSKEIPLY